jgi:hypothetical protein
VATYPTPPKPSAPKPKTGGGGGSKSSGGGGGGSRSTSSSRSSSSSSSGGDPYARARADQKASEKKAAARLTAQAQKLAEQAAALRIALGSKGFKAQVLRELGNADLEFNEEDKLLLSQYARGKGALEKQAATTEDQRARGLADSGSNAGRERNEALQQGIENGISASDMIKAQAASLRSWSFNAGQVQTNYTDEINGIQSEHAQMVNSVVTSRQQAWREREQQKSQLFRGYYDNRGQVLTEIGNKLGEAAQYYDMANEQASSSTSRSKSKSTQKSAMDNLRAAALETGKGYKERATPTSITKWEGTANIKNTTDARQWAKPELEIKDAEGASGKLRKWEG